MTSGEIYALKLRKENGIKGWRALMGVKFEKQNNNKQNNILLCNIYCIVLFGFVVCVYLLTDIAY